MAIFRRGSKSKAKKAQTLFVRSAAKQTALREDRHASPTAAPMGFRPNRESQGKTHPKSR